MEYLSIQDHNRYMKIAIGLAKKGRGKVSPNPMVGCVVVKNGNIIGEGYHEKYGDSHAEVNALSNCTESPHDATMYINLEPCSIYGKTPPCIEKIIKEGIREVYVGIKDINPEINGKGIEELEKHSIKVYSEILYDECYELNKFFFKWIETGKPWIIAKVAQTRDGYMGLDSNSSIWITGKQSRVHSHKLRSEVDGILIGTNTARIDDPSLTVREVAGKNPARIIVDTNRSLPLTLKIFNDNLADTIILCSRKKFTDNRTSFCKYLGVNESDNSLDPNHMIDVIGANGITSIIIEGGRKILDTFYNADLIDEMYIYSSNSIIKNAKLKNPLKINTEWQITEELDLMDDKLIVARKKELCLQEL